MVRVNVYHPEYPKGNSRVRRIDYAAEKGYVCGFMKVLNNSLFLQDWKRQLLQGINRIAYHQE